MKPSARYRAMRAYQRARIARGRLAGGAWRWRGLRVLGYHRLADDGHTLSVAPARFRAQMEAVAASGARPVRLADALDLLERQVDEQLVAVTFDDGYADNVEHGEEVLGALGIPATVFVPTAVPDGEATFFWFRDPPAALGWEELAAAAERGVFDVQSHTRTHRWLPDLDDAEAEAEIAGSKRELEERLGRPVTTLCYPGGLHGPREARLVAAAGYRAGVTTDPGVNRGGAGRASLLRTLVYGEDDDAVFEAKLAGLLDAPPLARRLAYRRLGGFAAAPASADEGAAQPPRGEAGAQHEA